MPLPLEEQFHETWDIQLPALDVPVEFVLVTDAVKGVEPEYLVPQRIIYVTWVIDLPA